MAIIAASAEEGDPEAAARQCAEKWRQKGNINWADRYERMADTIAEVRNAQQHA